MKIAGLLLVLAVGGLPPEGEAELERGAKAESAASAEARGVAFLSREVPRWSRENGCFSCHNNGDAARALYGAAAAGFTIDRSAVAETTVWLSRPERWKENRGDERFSDKKLADLQFAAALAEAVRAGVVNEKGPLLRAAGIVASHQNRDGSWSIGPETFAGSPTTWGRTLATVVSRGTLARADPKRFGPAIRRADQWLVGKQAVNVLEAAALLLAPSSIRSEQKTVQCLKLIREGQADNGGWGPYVSSRPEAFDTAVVLLALSQLKRNAEVERLIGRGRQYLIDAQLPDGSWPETTRPSGAESYAHRMSTAGWAVMALVATGPRRAGPSRR